MSMLRLETSGVILQVARDASVWRVKIDQVQLPAPLGVIRVDLATGRKVSTVGAEREPEHAQLEQVERCQLALLTHIPDSDIAALGRTAARYDLLPIWTKRECEDRPGVGAHLTNKLCSAR